MKAKLKCTFVTSIFTVTVLQMGKQFGSQFITFCGGSFPCFLLLRSLHFEAQPCVLQNNNVELSKRLRCLIRK